jgi:precorrin-6B methylase 1
MNQEMPDSRAVDKIQITGQQLVERLQQLLHAGNARRVVVHHGDSIVAEFPLTVGVVGAALAPMLAAVGALAALIADCTIEVQVAATPPAPTLPVSLPERDEVTAGD